MRGAVFSSTAVAASGATACTPEVRDMGYWLMFLGGFVAGILFSVGSLFLAVRRANQDLRFPNR